VPDLAGSSSESFTIDTLRRAVDLYLAIAYAGGEVPEAVSRRLAWAEGPDLAGLLSGPPFEVVTRAEPGVDPVFALRLGNVRYPHMKLQVQPWPSVGGYLLSVNTHDQILSLSAGARGSEAFRELQAENQRIKEEIELAWERNGLPTFLNYLRGFIAEQGGEGEGPMGPA
jgi:hypothetical protein